MFWDAVASGLGTLAHWQTYAAALLFLLLSVGPIMLIGLAMLSSGRAAAAIGCLSMLVVPFLQTFALVVFVLTLAPLMLGFFFYAMWSFPWLLLSHDLWFMVKLVGKLLIVEVVLAFVPMLGRMQSLHTLLLGGLALALVVGIIEHNSPARTIPMWPGFWFVVGLLIVGGALAWVGMILAAIIATAVDAKAEGLGQLVAFPVAAALGFVPLFIYAGWLGTQIRGA